MLNRSLRAVLLSMTAAGIAVTAFAQQPAPAPQPAPAAAEQAAKPADPVVARVNGGEIRRSDVSRMLAQLPPQVQQMPMEMIFPALVEQLVNQKLVSDAGYKANLQQSQEVKDEIKRAEERAVQRAYIQNQVESKITEQRLQDAYKEYVAHNPPQEEVKASHILVESEAEAKSIIDDLAKGGDFAKIAREKSKDPTAAAQGGDLGYFTRETMVEPFANAAFGMAKGETSKAPVQTQFGWHVIRVEDKRTQPQPTLDEVKPQLEQELSKEIVTALVDELRSGAKIETFQMDGSPMPAAPAAPAPAPAQTPAK